MLQGSERPHQEPPRSDSIDKACRRHCDIEEPLRCIQDLCLPVAMDCSGSRKVRLRGCRIHCANRYKRRTYTSIAARCMWQRLTELCVCVCVCVCVCMQSRTASDQEEQEDRCFVDIIVGGNRQGASIDCHDRYAGSRPGQCVEGQSTRGGVFELVLQSRNGHDRGMHTQREREREGESVCTIQVMP
jgi:hypothetical protein